MVQCSNRRMLQLPPIVAALECSHAATILTFVDQPFSRDPQSTGINSDISPPNAPCRVKLGQPAISTTYIREMERIFQPSVIFGVP